ncbi:hypothetical protein O6H91_18G023300 [Diphasiastrum complanatum]|nr:hypothetical protein O6H91_18G023300 [Diphasiastrum complanatum]KAJ7522703.1 hypothetical protein O6H91_18G023300 [Diphasiastrum complanatum]
MAAMRVLWRRLMPNSSFSSNNATMRFRQSVHLQYIVEIIPGSRLRSSGPELPFDAQQAVAVSSQTPRRLSLSPSFIEDVRGSPARQGLSSSTGRNSLAASQAGNTSVNNFEARMKCRELAMEIISFGAHKVWRYIAVSRVLNGYRADFEHTGRSKFGLQKFYTLDGKEDILCPEFRMPSKVQKTEGSHYKILPSFTFGGKRGFAKVAVPPNMQHGVKLKLYLGSSGMIGEPYKRPPSLPFFQRWLTIEGWKLRKEYIMGQLKTGYTLAKLRQKNRGYSQQKFYHDASDLYKKVNVALAQGDRSSLRQLVTDNLFSVMKNELKHREASWPRVEWELVGHVKKIRTLQARMIGFEKSNPDNAFVQITLKLLSNQKFMAYDAQGKLVAGDKDKELLVEDIWVFEKPLLLSDAKWRLCGRISI